MIPRDKFKALVVLSGGQDSTACLYWALKEFKYVHTITFDYQQRHRAEIEAARLIANVSEASSWKLLHLPQMFGSSPLTNTVEELEQYTDRDSLPGGLEKTFVPMRNQIMLSVAGNYAYSLGIRNIVTGVCQEDFGGYPDCRQMFIDVLEATMNMGTFTGMDGALDAVTIHTPLMYKTKADTVEMALKLEGCYEATAFSHTSYDGQYPPTGKDHATLLREKGFAEAGIPDPLILRAFIEGRMRLPQDPPYEQETVNRYLPRVRSAMQRYHSA